MATPAVLGAPPVACRMYGSRRGGAASAPPRPASRLRRRPAPGPALAVLSEAPPLQFPSFLPPEVAEIQEQAALDVARAMRRVPVRVGDTVVDTAHVPPAQRGSGSVVLCVHGFDSSSFEFRRFLPLLSKDVETWAVDVLGCGFTAFNAGATCTPEARREHLLAFITQHIGRPCVVLGASLGAATAIDLATTRPDLVTGVVLVDGQVFEEAPQLQGPLAWLGCWVLRAVWLRSLANKLAYHDKQRYATLDAMLVGRLHTHLPSWAAANVAWLGSGGYRVADKLGSVAQRALVVWGQNDEIVPPASAARLASALPNVSRVCMVDACGHVAHLEQPAVLRDAVVAFLAELA